MVPEFSMFYKKNSRHFLKVPVKLRGNFDEGTENNQKTGIEKSHFQYALYEIQRDYLRAFQCSSVGIVFFKKISLK